MPKLTSLLSEVIDWKLVQEFSTLIEGIVALIKGFLKEMYLLISPLQLQKIDNISLPSVGKKLNKLEAFSYLLQDNKSHISLILNFSSSRRMRMKVAVLVSSVF
jgi:hypothetical protein